MGSKSQPSPHLMPPAAASDCLFTLVSENWQVVTFKTYTMFRSSPAYKDTMTRVCISMYILPYLYIACWLVLSFQEVVQHTMDWSLGDKYMDGKIMYNRISIDQLGLIKNYMSHIHVITCTIILPMGYFTDCHKLSMDSNKLWRCLADLGPNKDITWEQEVSYQEAWMTEV